MGELVLAGQTVLVTRPGDQGAELCRLISDHGGNAIHYPTLELLASDVMDENTLQQSLLWSTHAVFISRNAVRFAARIVHDLVDLLSSRITIATGPGTADVLEEHGISEVSFPPSGSNSEAMLTMKELAPGNIRGARVLIIRGGEGRTLLEQNLLQRGAEVHYADVYCRKLPRIDSAVGDTIWQEYIPDIIVVTSNQGLHNLVDMTEHRHTQQLFSRRLVVMSQRIAENAVLKGFEYPPVVAGEQSNEGLIQAIEQSVEFSR